MKLKLFFITALAFLNLATSISAASFSVRLGEPRSPTRINNFKLTFVALDTQDRNITVKCFIKTPSSGSFSQFDDEKILIPGGNTDSCEVYGGLIGQQGTYDFYVTASTDGETIPSSTVSVDYLTDGPSTPVHYSKERVTSCDYKIKFKTADDGKTVKVQLFRSDNLSIGINDANVIATQIVGPNTEGEFINSVPDCGKDYYYAVRAVDSSDNVSISTGDSFTTTTTTGTTTTTDADTSAGGTLLLDGEGSQVSTPGSSTDDSDVDGDKTGEEGEELIDGSTESAEILGTSTDEKENKFKWLIIPAVGIAFFFLRKFFAKELK